MLSPRYMLVVIVLMAILVLYAIINASEKHSLGWAFLAGVDSCALLIMLVTLFRMLA